MALDHFNYINIFTTVNSGNPYKFMVANLLKMLINLNEYIYRNDLYKDEYEDYFITVDYRKEPITVFATEIFKKYTEISVDKSYEQLNFKLLKPETDLLIQKVINNQILKSKEYATDQIGRLAITLFFLCAFVLNYENKNEPKIITNVNFKFLDKEYTVEVQTLSSVNRLLLFFEKITKPIKNNHHKNLRNLILEQTVKLLNFY